MTPSPTLTPVPPTPTPTHTPTPTPTLTAAQKVPPLTMSYAGQMLTPLGFQFCEREEDSTRVCVELPFENATPGRISLLRGSAASLQITGPRPDEVRIEYLTDTGIPTGQPETRPGDNLLLLTITPEPGNYIMTLNVKWAESDATYYFRVTVTG